ncbi:MAG: N-acetyltransferase [Chloroflexi bacterium]|nr:N-acetyltransferase [Chloroflexota bacterium]
MNIRPADMDDLDLVCSLDHSYQTDHVWQLSGKVGTEELSAVLRLAKLPRAITVRPSLDTTALRRTLHRADHLWVVEGEVPAGQGLRNIVGYLAMTVLPWQHTGWVTALTVRADARRKGVATRLLQIANDQARSIGLHSITLDVPTKNYPASRMCTSLGMYFCGYSENYYPTHDIALFFATRIHS